MIDLMALGSWVLANGPNIILAGEIVGGIAAAALGKFRMAIACGAAALVTLLLGW